MTQEMFDALMTYLEVYSKEDKKWYKEQFDEGKTLTLTVFSSGQVLENWE